MATRTVDDLRPNPRNPRKITDKKLAMLAKALERFGDLGGIVYNRTSGQLVGGHQRLKALPAGGQVVLEEQHDTPLPNGTVASGYIDVKGARYAYREVQFDAATEKAANLAANKGAGEFDMVAVADWIGELDTGDFDLDLTMFDEDELAAIMAPESAPEEADGQDEEVEPRPEPNVKPGDLYAIGNHRLLCGDSTVLDDVEKAMGGAKADMVWTDPPYGVSYVGKTKESLVIQNDGSEGLGELLQASLGNAATVTKPGAVWYVAAPAGPQSLEFSKALTDLGVWRQTLVWVKNSLVMGHSDFHYRHEIIYYGWTPDGAHQAPADRKQDTVWEVPRPTKSKEHPTMKPLALIERSIQHSSRARDVVFEPFGGSGSTMMACEKTGRRCVSLEIDPVYCQVILDRAEKLFGLKAELLSSGGEADHGG